MIAIKFMSSKDNDEDRVMCSKSDKVGTMINDKTDEVKEEFFQSLLSTHQIGLETSIKGNVSYLIVFTYCIINNIK